MATLRVLEFASFATAFFACAGLFRAVVHMTARRTAAARAQRSQGSGAVLQRTLRNGFPLLVPVAKLVLNIDVFAAFFHTLGRIVSDKGIEAESDRLCSVALALVACSFVVGACIGGSLVAGLAVAGCLCAVAFTMISTIRDKRNIQLRESIPEVLRSMSVCFHAGFTMQQTFKQLESEAPRPLDALFMRASHVLETGGTVDDALDVIRRENSVRELSFIAVALSIQHRAGGSMQAVLEAACDSLENELELQRNLRVQTAQAKLSARVVSVVTLAMVAALSLISHDFLAPFFQSVLGVVMLAVAVIMQVAGVLVVRRMLKVEVC